YCARRSERSSFPSSPQACPPALPCSGRTTPCAPILPSYMKTILSQTARSFLILYLPGSLVFGQRSAAPAESQIDDHTIQLSPFEVNTDQDVGYLAANTLAGSRFNTALRDTPAAISVMTPEFLSDIGAFSVSEALSWATNVEVFEDDDRA